MSLALNTNLFSPGQTLLLGVSGGLDSVVLLDILSKSSEFKLNLVIAHCNHQIRKDTAERDALFVEGLAKRYGLEFVLGLRDVPRFAQEHKLSLEDAARIQRYEFLKAESKRVGAAAVALAHHRDDQTETILIRFLRGAAAKGLTGMPEQRTESGVVFIRPLLNASRAQIEQYARENKLEHVEDETNQDTVFLRNKLRQEIIPLLKQTNPNLDESLERMAAIFRDEDNYLDSLAAATYAELILSEQPRQIRLDGKSLRNYPKALQRRVIRMAIDKLATLQTISLLYVENFLDNELNSLWLDEQDNLQVGKN